MIVVDTSVWIDFFRKVPTPQTDRLRTGSHDDEIVVGDLILLEVLQGARDHAHAAGLAHDLRKFPIVPMTSPKLAVEVARIYRELRGVGVTVRKTVDLAIATFCIANNHSLLQNDRDFEAIAGHFPLQLL